MTVHNDFVQLGWTILEHCYRYYILDKPSVSDDDFDKLKLEYNDWCEFLGDEPYTTNMVGFDETRPSCKLVAFKFQSGKLK